MYLRANSRKSEMCLTEVNVHILEGTTCPSIVYFLSFFKQLKAATKARSWLPPLMQGVLSYFLPILKDPEEP